MAEFPSSMRLESLSSEPYFQLEDFPEAPLLAEKPETAPHNSILEISGTTKKLAMLAGGAFLAADVLERNQVMGRRGLLAALGTGIATSAGCNAYAAISRWCVSITSGIGNERWSKGKRQSISLSCKCNTT